MTSGITLGAAERLLADLIALPTVNPMGGPHDDAEPVERPVTDYVGDFFRPYALEVKRHACSRIHENLLVVVPGRDASGYTLLESHADTVPAEDWAATAFVPRIKGHAMFGRGACDDKGPLVAMMLAVRELVEQEREPPHPVAFLTAGDEEYAQTGIQHFVGLDYPIARAVIGEPTRLQPMIQHKGTVRWDITIHGRSAHSCQPQLGCDAIAGAMEVIRFLRDYQEDLRRRWTHPLLDGPTVTVTMIQGGRTRNAVADECTLAVDFRVLPGMSPASARQELINALDLRHVRVTHSDAQLLTPPLNTQPDHAFSTAVLAICREATDCAGLSFAAAPYGTDAAWVPGRSPAIVLGPGSIEHAHAVDEQIDLGDVCRCAHIYLEILMWGA